VDFPSGFSDPGVIHRHHNRPLLALAQPLANRPEQLLRTNTVTLIQPVRRTPIAKLMPASVEQTGNSVRSQTDQLRQLMLSDAFGIATIKTPHSLGAQVLDNAQ
jgi:hypothetical protein